MSIQPSPPPADEAIVGGSIRAEASRQVAPRRAAAQGPEDAIEDTAVIYLWYTGLLDKIFARWQLTYGRLVRSA